MPEPDWITLSEIDLTQPISLIVAWSKSDYYESGYVKISTEVAEYLREACGNTITLLEERHGREYFADMALDREEYLHLEDEDFVADSAVAEAVLPIGLATLITSRSLPMRRLALYAAVVGQGDERVAFVRKANPRAGVRSGSMVTSLGNTLSKLEKPIFTLDDRFDLLVTETGIVALSQNIFEMLFRDTPALQQQIPTWVGALSAGNRTFAGDGAARLAERCATDGRLRKRVRNIAERGHLVNVSTARIRQHIKSIGLKEKDFLTTKGELLFDIDNPFRLVYLLNEDFFTGGLTDEPFQSDGKAPRT